MPRSLISFSLPSYRQHGLLLVAIGSIALLHLSGGRCAADVLPATAPVRTVESVRVELQAATIPRFDPARANEAGYRERHHADFEKALALRADLIGELHRIAPTDASIRKLVVERWRALGQLNRGTELADEITVYFKTPVTADEGDDAPYFAAIIELQTLSQTDQDRLAAIERYRERSLQDDRLIDVSLFAVGLLKDAPAKVQVLDAALNHKPTPQQASAIEGQLLQLRAIGQPFELEFTDALAGKPVSIESLKGKVILIDFWATWCGPCRALVPELRELHAAYHARGFEIISVSLDSAGEEHLAKLRKIAVEDGMNWHHFYQGDGFDSAFSSRWGITSIPQLFLIDRDGKLVSTDARRGLKQRVESLLK